jgi:PPIC-type PPIASE domain
MQYSHLARSINKRGPKGPLLAALVIALFSAATNAGTLATLGDTNVTSTDIDGLFARTGQKTSGESRFTDIAQGKELISALLLVFTANATGAETMALTADEQSRLKVVSAKAKLDSLLEISDQRVEEAARREPTLYDQRIKEVYETATAQFIAPKKAKAAHILLRTEKRTITEAAALAEQLVARARAGENFEALAKQYSDDERSKDQGGVLGEYADSKKGDHPIEIAAFWTKRENNIADPVLGRAGIHIVKILSETPSVRATLKEAAPVIKLALIAQQKTLERRKWSQLFSDAVASKATFNDAEIQKLVAPATAGDREKIENALKLLGVSPKPEEPAKPAK